MTASEVQGGVGTAQMGGLFITFEGIDGCGKSTQARMLGERMRAEGLPVLETREPGGTEIGNQMRRILLDEANTALVPKAELLLYLADRVQHLEECILPALRAGQTVLCDRYHDATVAYQQYGRGLSLESLRGFIEPEIMAHPPHLTFWMDITPAEARTRMEERARTDASQAGQGRFDLAHADFHDRVRAGYQALYAAHPGRIVRLDAAGTREEIHALVWDTVWATMEERRGGR